jgi:hypothetical protein
VKFCGAKAALALAMLLGASHFAAAQLMLGPPAKQRGTAARPSTPPPVVIPEEFAPPQEVYAAFPEQPAAVAAPAAPSACQQRLAKIAVFTPLPALVGAGECGAPDAVHLDAVILPDQSKVMVTPAGVLRCPMAEELARWVRDDVAPVTQKKLGSPVRVLDNYDSYECRGSNRVRGAMLSEHGRANAIDVRLFKLADGRSLTLTDMAVDKAWREAIKASVCARFSTVLGPGSDGNHEEHIHLDLAERHNNFRLCEWDVREPPPPAVATAAPKPAGDETTPSADATADEGDETAAPLDVVPLPRPRPKLADGAAPRAKKPN